MANGEHDEHDEHKTSERRHEFNVRWAVGALVIVCVTVLLGLGVMVPISYFLAGRETVVSFSFILTVSVALSVVATVSGIGWATSARGRSKLVREIRTLKDENRKLRAQLKADREDQPQLGEANPATKEES